MLKLLRPSVTPVALSARLGLRSARSPAVRYYSILNVKQKPQQRSSRQETKQKYSTQSTKVPLYHKLKLAASFSFYTAVVLGGVGLFGLVVYYFVSEVLLPTSDVQLFNKTFSIIKKDPQCQKLLGTKMKAHGEASGNKWSRSRPVASRRGFDNNGREHLWMQFHVEGDLIQDAENGALVRLEMVRDPHGSNAFEYRYLVLEVPHQPRLYLIDNTPTPAIKNKNTGFLGVKWGKKD